MACTSRTTFVLERDEEGRVTEAFTPDFYLPEQDLYLEVTVMKQSLVTRKNRKLRKLRQLYPDVKIKLFYERDFATARGPLRAAEGVLSASAPLDERIGEVFLDAGEIRRRVRELGAEIARDYAGREPLLVGSLKACIPFICDLSRATPDPPRARLRRAGGLRRRPTTRARWDPLPEGPRHRDRGPRRGARRRGRRHRPDDALPRPVARSCAVPRRSTVATLFDRPYRRLVDDLPVGYVGFTIPDEFFVGYGFDLDERFRNLPDLRLRPLRRAEFLGPAKHRRSDRHAPAKRSPPASGRSTRPSTGRASGSCRSSGRPSSPASRTSTPATSRPTSPPASRFGYRLVWVIVAANLLAMLIQTLSAKLGIATGRNLPEVCREQFSRRMTFRLWVQAELIAMATDLAEFLGAAIGFHLLIGLRPVPVGGRCGHRGVRDPRAAALRRAAARGGDRDARRRDRRLLPRRARLRPSRLRRGAPPRRRAGVRRQRGASCSRSGSSARP